MITYISNLKKMNSYNSYLLFIYLRTKNCIMLMDAFHTNKNKNYGCKN